MKKENKVAAIAIGAAAVAGAAAATLLSAVKLLSDTAVKKELPKVMKPLRMKISGGSELAPELVDAATEKATELLSLCSETVTVRNRDGLTLSARWLRHPSPERIVVAMHGWRSSWLVDFSLCAKFLYDEGCSILFPDQRCHGESEGEHIGFGIFERFDCVDWVNYVLESESNDLPVYLLGVSMGATTVLLASELDLPSRVKGIIADCGFTSPNDIWQHVMQNNLRIKGKLALNLANFYVSREAALDTKSASTVDAVANTDKPILFAHGDKDTFVPIEMTYRNYEACASEKMLIVAEGAEHGLSFYVDPEKYKSAVREFFNKFD